MSPERLTAAGDRILSNPFPFAFSAIAVVVRSCKNRVKDPMTRGLIQGGTLNVFGVAASYQESAGEEPTTTTTTTETTTLTRDVSTATMILTGVAGTVLVNIPVIRSLLLSIALGSTTAGSVVPLPDDAFMRQR